MCGQTWGLGANVVECHSQQHRYRAPDPVLLPPFSEEGVRTMGKSSTRVTSKFAAVWDRTPSLPHTPSCTSFSPCRLALTSQKSLPLRARGLAQENPVPLGHLCPGVMTILTEPQPHQPHSCSAQEASTRSLHTHLKSLLINKARKETHRHMGTSGHRPCPRI